MPSLWLTKACGINIAAIFHTQNLLLQPEEIINSFKNYIQTIRGFYFDMQINKGMKNQLRMLFHQLFYLDICVPI